MAMVLAIALAIGSAVYLWYQEVQTSNRARIDELFRPLSPPPARLVTCRGAMDAACAQTAADRIGITVAWLDAPPGYRLEWMLANDRTVSTEVGVIASQYFLGSDGRGMFEVVTSVPPIGDGPPPTRAQSLSHGADTGSLWVDARFGIVSIEWTHEGIVYLITAQPRPWNPDAVVDAWRTIHYASPATTG
jgi:hypothetical protein